MKAPSPVVGRFLAVGLLAIALLLTWSWIVAPVSLQLAANYETIGRTRQLLDRYRQLAEARPDLERQLALRRESEPANELVFQADNAGIAAAELQRTVTSIAARTGSLLRSTQALPQSDDAPNRIAVRVNLVAGMEDLARTIHALESAKPYLFIDNMAIRAQNAPVRRRLRTQQVSAQPPANETELQIRFDVYGYMQTWH